MPKPAPPQTTPQLRAMYALRRAREVRHHRDCMCGRFDHFWCNVDDKRWTQNMDRELETLGATCASPSTVTSPFRTAAKPTTPQP